MLLKQADKQNLSFFAKNTFFLTLLCFVTISSGVYADTTSNKTPVVTPSSLKKYEEFVLPQLSQEKQHAKSARRISDLFVRAHYKKVKIDDELSAQIFLRYLDLLDNSKHFFLANDIEGFEKYANKFDEAIKLGDLSVAYDIYQANLERRQERYKYALTLLSNEFDFEQEEDRFYYDREDAAWATSESELNELWRQRVKYDALNLQLAEKTWDESKEILDKRYKRAIRRLSQTNSEDVFQTVMNAFARSIEAHTSYLSPRRTERF
ncbi:MAG: carboxyl-terminal processing protease, partial [Yoonia sp.]